VLLVRHVDQKVDEAWDGEEQNIELSNCSSRSACPEVGLSSAGLSDRRHPPESGRSPSSLTFCRKLCLLGARKHSKRERDKLRHSSAG
jgi:hypothetical protein